MSSSTSAVGVSLSMSLLAAAATRGLLANAQYTTTWQVNNLPKHSEGEQTGINNCGTTNSQSSECQTMFVNTLEDFCLWGPPEPNSQVGVTEQIQVAWCTMDGRGSRTIPEGTLQGVHFVQTPDFIQLTGIGDFTKMNIQAGDEGGELDPHGPDGKGNPHGGLVFSDAFGGGTQQIHEWTNFMSDSEFCIRVCKPGPNAWLWCNHIYDVMGCEWNMPADYSSGVFETCDADSGTPMGLYSGNGNAWGSTFHQGSGATPNAHPAPASSSCTSVASIAVGGMAASVSAAPVSANSTSPASSSTTTSTTSMTSSIASSTSKTTSAATSGSTAAGRNAAGLNASGSSSAVAAPTTSKTGGAVNVAVSLVSAVGVTCALVAALLV